MRSLNSENCWLFELHKKEGGFERHLLVHKKPRYLLIYYKISFVQITSYHYSAIMFYSTKKLNCYSVKKSVTFLQNKWFNESHSINFCTVLSLFSSSFLEGEIHEYHILIQVYKLQNYHYQFITRTHIYMVITLIVPKTWFWILTF